MMPGETRPAAPGTAAELTRCQGCASLQQNLNEYVDALITLKQKIINTDNLLTEYQKKCDELQFARRENSTLHHQVEQMLQKISPLQQCQEELGSLKAELEEKKSSLKLYQDTHQEYARVKEECLKSDAQKKKLEAKVKKLEEAAVKHTQDFKQLRNEKKILEKEFRKTQERLDEFSKQKNERELRHIGTQISSDSLGNIDKRRVKLLLKELWLCINTAHKLPGDGGRRGTEKPARESSPLRECGAEGSPRAVGGSPSPTADVRTCLTELSMEIEGSFSPCASAEETQRGSRAAAPGARALAPVDEDLQAAVDFFRMPPPLLSPVPSPPLVSLPPWGTLPSPLEPESCVEDSAISSDSDCAQHRGPVEAVSEDEPAESPPRWGAPRAAQGCGRGEEKRGVQEGPDRVTSVGFGTFTTTLSEPSTTFSFAREQRWAAGSEFKRSGPEDAQGAVQELDKAVQTEGTPLRHRSCARDTKSPGKPCVGSPLPPQPLSELLEAPATSLQSRVMVAPLSRLTEWTLTSRVTPGSNGAAGAECFQDRSGAWDKDKEDRALAGDCLEPEGAGAAGGAPGPSVPQAPALPPSRDSPPSAQRLQQRAESPASWKGERDQDTSSGLSPSEAQGPLGRDATQAPSAPQSLFARVPADGPSGRQSPRAHSTSHCQPVSGGRDLSLHQRTSWHQSPMLHEVGPEGGPRATAGSPPAAPAIFPDSASAFQGDESLGVLKATAKPQSNQVSVITKQTRLGPLDRAWPALPRLPQEKEAPLMAAGPPARTEPLVPPDPVRGREREGAALKAWQAVAMRRASPEVSSTCRKLDFDAPSGSLTAGGSHHFANSILSLSYDHISAQKRESGPEAVVLPEVQRWRSRGSSPEPAVPVPRGLPAQERPSVTPATQQSPREPPERCCQSPVLTAVASASGKAQGPPCAGPPESLPGVLYHYTGVREQQRADTEVEESEAPSCSEGEAEPEAAPAAGATLGVALARPGPELGALTSALQHCSLAVDRLSTSDVALFLESCRLRDSSSGDSVSESSSKGGPSQDQGTPQELTRPGGAAHSQPDAAGESQEPFGGCPEEEEEEEEGPLQLPSQLSQCSLDTLAKVLARLGRELHSGPVDARLREAGSLLLLNVLQQVVAEDELGADLAPGSGGTSARSSPAGDPAMTRAAEGQEEVLLEPAGSQGSGETPEETPAIEPPEAMQTETYQCQISTVTSEVINVLLNKDQNLVIEKGDNWTIINGVTLVPNVDQVIVCDPPGAGLDAEFPSCSYPEEEEEEEVEEAAEAAGPECPAPAPASDPSCVQEISSSGQGANFDKSRLRNRPVKPSTRISSEIFDQDFEESPTIVFDHTYFNSKLEPATRGRTRSRVASREPPSRPAKASSRADPPQGEAPESSPGERGNSKSQRTQTQTVLANADTSTPTDGAGDTLSKIRQEVGPPLPPLLAPLVATPPRASRSVSPLVSSSSPASPLAQLSPLSEAPGLPAMSPLPEDPVPPSPLCTTASPSATSADERILSSPLQFCAATPKHALPVPGRLPPLAASAHSAVAGPQENSVKILDTMYPELSARARTLSLLKGNLQLARGPADSENRPAPVSAISGFKAITSTSTAFVKTGSSGGDSQQDKPRAAGGKRPPLPSSLRSAKRLRLHGASPEPEPRSSSLGGHRNLRRRPPAPDAAPPGEERGSGDPEPPASQAPPKPKETVESHDRAIADALKKIAEAAFDLLPVIRSHVYVGNISKKPVMRDQEKEVVHEFSTARKHLAECLLHSILLELKAQKASLEHSYVHALCRVYVGVCRQLGDLERARLFCYSLLKEDFPESEKLALFIANMWHDIFISPSVISKAMQLVARQRAKGEVLNCLRAFLNWEKNAPVDVGFMVSKLLLTVQLCPKTEFQASEKFGEDLSANTWEHIFAIDLLCCHQKWVWTHDNIISKELWPVMDKWVKYRKGHPNITYTPDIIIASILRLIGRLGQLGLKEGFPSAVKNISSVIGMFIQHARDEDIPWGIQLAAVYALCDLSPSNPAEISKILEAWRKETSHSVPAAVAGCLEEVSSLCAEGLS
ncbi:little elongation complex subunit 1 [Sorex fumeus]|uniref:little elongation complex subunit 1 n=1 Tax=Sorex fumeus TaxID=62283 RepID=UPI0024ACD01A|nr:little elongation complex subunit 1 [Sorex fumeus]